MTASKWFLASRAWQPTGARRKKPVPRDWNVVISTRGEGYRAARAALREFGRMWPTEYFNVLVMKVADIAAFLEDFRSLAAVNPALIKDVGRIAPAAEVFDFATAPEFEQKLREIALRRIPALAGKSFHCRIHGRGLRPLTSARSQEQDLNRTLLDVLAAGGTPGRLDFADPDAVLAVETVGHRAGVSLWTREDLRKYPFLRTD
jgi:tRNA(Ser,Leu) C12 N-acetylase TAN1